MKVFEAIPKQWGNSIGITIPAEIIKKEQIAKKKKIKILVLSKDMDKLREAFGSLKLKESTQKAMDEIDEGYD